METLTLAMLFWCSSILREACAWALYWAASCTAFSLFSSWSMRSSLHSYHLLWVSLCKGGWGGKGGGGSRGERAGGQREKLAVLRGALPSAHDQYAPPYTRSTHLRIKVQGGKGRGGGGGVEQGRRAQPLQLLVHKTMLLPAFVSLQ